MHAIVSIPSIKVFLYVTKTLRGTLSFSQLTDDMLPDPILLRGEREREREREGERERERERTSLSLEVCVTCALSPQADPRLPCDAVDATSGLPSCFVWFGQHDA